MARSTPTITTPQPFTIRFPDADVEEMQTRLRNARIMPALLPDEERKDPTLLPSPAWLKMHAALWADLDVRAFEKELNRLPHFTTEIDWCKPMHFIHLRSSRPDAIPLIMIHGWPGSFHEFCAVVDGKTVIEHLAEPADPAAQAFHVVVPSLPGFLFSGPPPNREVGTGDFNGYSRILDALMRGLGYRRYASAFSQGGDWGSVHARCLGAKFADADGDGCRAVHLNFCPTGPKSKLAGLLPLLPASVIGRVLPWILTSEQLEAATKGAAFASQAVYYQVQRLRPTQFGAALVDSPLGLLSWLGFFYLKPLSLPSNNPVRNPSATLTPRALLETCTLFHLTRSIGSSFLPYTVNPHLRDIVSDPQYRLPRFAFSEFPTEIINAPREWVAGTGNLTFYAKASIGGHFAALEAPAVFVEHVQRAFAPGGKQGSVKALGGIKGEGLHISAGLWDEERKKDKQSVASKL